jgi:hypothetical protein
MSAPATKDFSPAPVRTTALTTFVSIASNVAARSSRTCELRALSASGRLIVTIATLSFNSQLTNPILFSPY